MNTRDFDALLRDFADDGEDILPEEYFDAALAEVGSMPQRSAQWAALTRTRPMNSQGRKISRQVAGYGLLGAAAVAALAVGIGLYASTLTQGEPPVPGRFTPTDVDRIVPAGDAALAGLKVWSFGSDVLTRRDPFGNEVEAVTEWPGLLHARTISWPGEEGGWAWGWVAVFEDDVSAMQTLRLYVDEYQTATGGAFADVDRGDPALGDESVSLIGPVPNSIYYGPESADSASPAIAYIWRVDNLLLYVFAFGPAEGDGSFDAVVNEIESRRQEP